LKKLGLYRHAKSDWHDARARDFDRPLNQRGRRAAALMGQHMRQHGIAWDRILASPAVRCAETFEIGSAAVGKTYPAEWDRRIYLASSATLEDILREQSDEITSLLMIGHNPGLEDLIFDLVPDDGSALREIVEVKFPTAAYAVIELDIASWVHLTRPRDLDPELGPEPVT
jgi:phosphohistidine phosphatase